MRMTRTTVMNPMMSLFPSTTSEDKNERGLVEVGNRAEKGARGPNEMIPLPMSILLLTPRRIPLRTLTISIPPTFSSVVKDLVEETVATLKKSLTDSTPSRGSRKMNTTFSKI